MLDEGERRHLLEVARDTLKKIARHPGRGARLVDGDEREDEAAGPGAFVSLHTDDHALRGCVGCMSSNQDLEAVVREMTVAAATRDPRFPPVRPDEVDALDIEISVLEPAERLRSVDEIEVGRDGLIAVGRGRRGVLLPQVAAERGWDRWTFAAQTCAKAGLPPEAVLDDDVELYRFSAEVFGERRPRPS